MQSLEALYLIVLLVYLFFWMVVPLLFAILGFLCEAADRKEHSFNYPWPSHVIPWCKFITKDDDWLTYCVIGTLLLLSILLCGAMLLWATTSFAIIVSFVFCCWGIFDFIRHNLDTKKKRTKTYNRLKGI